MPCSLIIRTLQSTPDLLALHQHNPVRYPHLLSSNALSSTEKAPVQINEQVRYDILFACPQQTIKADKVGFLQQLDQAWRNEKKASDQCVIKYEDEQATEKNNLPFSGGWFLYLSYEFAQQIETSLNLPEADDGLPIAFATRFPAAIIFDALKQQSYLICEAAYSQYVSLIENDILNNPMVNYQQPFEVSDMREDDETYYLAELDKLHQYIIDGDVFQVNLSRRWQTRLTTSVSHASIYKQLIRSNPGPFNALLTLGDKAIISSSPERLVQQKDGWVQTRPIAGTRPRSTNDKLDNHLSDELLANAKERAEHVMLIDLQRNDLGRVCMPGSIEVNEFMVLESYQHVHHIVSNIKGRLRQNITPGQLIAAVFPGGTITGCPKVRCMEILAELEQMGRGAYTGSLGYLNHDGSMDLNILIRSIIRDGDKLQFRAGGGIVVDSDSQKELKETRSKAKGLIHALQAGNR